jgi:hypothetical protein
MRARERGKDKSDKDFHPSDLVLQVSQEDTQSVSNNPESERRNGRAYSRDGDAGGRDGALDRALGRLEAAPVPRSRARPASAPARINARFSR